MRIARPLLIGCLMAGLSGPVLGAGDDAPLDDVRAYYRQAAEHWTAMPTQVMEAFTAAEDRHFFARPLDSSVITRQVSRWLLAPRASAAERTRAVAALAKALTHQEVLTLYVNRIYLGQRCYGASDAANAYFGKPLTGLDVAEIAYLAGLPKAPMLFNAYTEPDRALERRNLVLTEMVEAGFLSDADAARAQGAALAVRSAPQDCALD